MGSSESPTSATIDQERRRIGRLVEEIAALAGQPLPVDDFYSQFVGKVTGALESICGAVWWIEEGDHPRLLQESLWERAQIDPETPAGQQNLGLIQKVASQRCSAIFAGEQIANDHPVIGQAFILLAPISCGNECRAVLEIVQSGDLPVEVCRRQLRFVEQMASLAANYMTARKLRAASDQQSLLNRLNQFTERVHGSLDVQETAFAVANEGRAFLDCDRLTVVVPKGKRYRIRAVSGQDVLDERSRILSLLKRLAKRAAATLHPLWYRGELRDLPPQLREVLSEYVDESHAAHLGVIPLLKETASTEEDISSETNTPTQASVVAVLIVEHFSLNGSQEHLEQHLALIEPHCTAAIANARRHSGVWPVHWWEQMCRLKWFVAAKQLPKTAVVAVILLLVVLSLFLVPARFEVKGEGRLRPFDRRDVFANLDAEVTHVYVDHGQRVHVGDKLFDLHSSELEIQLSDISAQLEATRQQSAGLQRELLEGSLLSAEEHDQLAGRVLELSVRERGLSEQLQLLVERRESLEVSSPVSGYVTTWDIREELEGRPVARGQVLVTIANTKGDWELEVDMPERYVGHLLDAQAELQKHASDARLPVRFELESSPGKNYTGYLVALPVTTTNLPEEGAVVRLLVSDIEVEQGLPDATAIVKVYCGRRSLGFVWFHEVYEFLQRWLF